MKKITFPIIIIKQNDSNIYYLNQREFGLVSKDGELFYNNGRIYDSKGNILIIKGIINIEKASLINIIKYFQPMYQVNLDTEYYKSVSVDEFKSIITNHIQTYKKHWAQRDEIGNLIMSILNKNTFTEIIEFIK